MASIRERLEGYWDRSIAALDQQARESSGGALFARCIGAGLADSVICFDERKRLVYPSPPAAPMKDPALERPEWSQAVRMEESSPGAAAEAYAAIVRSAADPVLRARALQAQGRCLIRAGNKEAAIQLVARSGYGRATDLQGRLIAADASLMALQFLKSPEDPRFLPLARRLRALVLDYENTPLSGSQRLFLMREMRALKLPQDLAEFPTFEAEQLAARYLETEPAPVVEAALRQTALAGIRRLGSANGQVLALLRTQSVLGRMRQFISDQRLVVSPPGTPAPAGNSSPLGMRLPGWRVTLLPADNASFGQPQRSLYLWTGFLVIAVMAIAALVAARLLQRQMRLARLKTDLVASVSHELKTPLASMRVLVDTLIEESAPDPLKTREYLELIARENARLSRLIENFLTFSRMERDRYSLALAETDAAEIVAGAVEAAGERFHAPGCRLDVKVDAGLPRLRADAGALITVLLNLLDNAYKYSPGAKRIAVRAYTENRHLCFEVEDHGIGLSPRESKKIFRKFYQADQRLSRTTGGCGLGLSIVEFIVKAHGGSISVKSKPGSGSTFKVEIPVDGR
ncbi:MAG: HAMP domain-containing sensor histidine kinase [Bryobacteraceae bacterium]